MKRFNKLNTAFLVFWVAGLMVIGLAGQADGQRRNERQVRDIVRSLNSKIDDFQYGLDYQLRSSSSDRQDINDVTSSLRNLQDKVSVFEENMMQRRENREDVNEIITAAKDVDAFLAQNRQNRRIETDWTDVRNLVNRLAANYSITPDWSTRISAYPDTTRDRNGNTVPIRSSASSFGLTGTYQLDTSLSENTSQIISGINTGNVEQAKDLENKLEAPEQIAIDVRGNQVTLASTKAPPITFTADGREKTETSGGRTLRVRATLRGQELTVSSLGGETDYTVTFVPAGNGKTLKVTRRITTEYLRETVFAESVYTKTDAVAQLGIDGNAAGILPDDGTYSSNDSNDRNSGYGSIPLKPQGRMGEFIIPNGTIVNAILDSEINTRSSQNNDRFKMTIQSPDQFRGSVIEGYLSGVGRSGQVSGRSNITFNFQRITLRNGQSYDFAGNLQSIRDQNGKVVKVDTEGTATGDSQTRETAVRGGIGAGLGAIIGAIAGGGRGAALGAILGGGAGAGSVIVQGRDDIRLSKGTTITVQASSPVRQNQPVSENN
jgi:hypothetical protein